MTLDADVIRDVNNHLDSNGVNFARKKMSSTGLSLNLNGSWEEEPLSDELQKITLKYRLHFDVERIHLWKVEDEFKKGDDSSKPAQFPLYNVFPLITSIVPTHN